MREFNFELLLQALRDEGVIVEDISATDVVILKKNHSTFIQTNTSTNATSYVSGWIADDKFYAKTFLKHKKIPVAKGFTFELNEKKDLIEKAEKLRFPLVLKPTQMGHGQFVISNIESIVELEKAHQYLIENHDFPIQFLVEEHVFGEEYRCFVTKTGFFAAVHRKPANLVGDGESTIEELIETINFKRMNPRINCLCTIKTDWLVSNHLEKKGLSLQTIPSLGEVIQLRPTSNVSQGGDCIDVTKIVHPSVKKFTNKVLQAIPHVAVLGIDLLCEDISKPLSKQKYSVCELNTMPGLSLHTVPGIGETKPVDKEVAQIILKTWTTANHKSRH